MPGVATAWPRSLRIGVGALLVITLLCWIGPLLRPFSAESNDWARLATAPAWTHGHWLGTDAIGRDVFVRTLVAGRLSLAVGALAASTALLIGLAYGAWAGLRGGWPERVMMRALDVISALPFLLLVILLLTLFERSAMLLLAAIAGYVWIDLARLMRAEAARLREVPYVLAAQTFGASRWWNLRRHVIPQLAPLALAYLGVLVPQAILIESFLGFLGLSVDEPTVSWGGLLAEGVLEMADAPWVLLPPAAMLTATLLACGALADGLRERADPRRGPVA